MKISVNHILTALTAIGITAAMALNAAAPQQMPRTTKEAIKGTASIATEHLQGTVEYVEGTTLVIRMADGAVREFNVPDSRRFVIDGKEVTVHELKPGTKLSAMITTTTTPIRERTTTVGTGKVWWVSGQTVILTLPNGENRQYTVKDDYKFNVNGKDNATVFDLRKGMTVSAQKIVEEPKTEIVSNTVVTGKAPPPPAPRPAVAQTPPPPVPIEAAQARLAPVQAAQAPAPTPVEVAQTAPEAPTSLPSSGSDFPLVGVLGLLLTGAGLGLCRIGRSRNL
jgi:hypothetical protein